jgi:FHA domain
LWQEPPPPGPPGPPPGPPRPQPGPPGPQPGPPGGLPQVGAQRFVQEAGPFESILLPAAGGGRPADLGVEQRAPLSRVRDVPPGTSSYSSESPIVQGVYCKNGHFDDPEALFCAVCGISMNQQTLINRPGTRPPLGVLLLDDGSVFQLDRDYVVGREPGLDATVASGRSRALRIGDDSGIVSRVHAKVALDGWRVLVTDLGSANGTKVRLPKNGGETVLAPHQPFVLTTGSQVDLGGRGFRYESHRGR